MIDNFTTEHKNRKRKNLDILMKGGLYKKRHLTKERMQPKLLHFDGVIIWDGVFGGSYGLWCLFEEGSYL